MNKNILTPEQLAALKNTFQPNKFVKTIRPHRIKFMGEFVTLTSGKTVWKKPGDAKSALNRHFRQWAFYGEMENSRQSIVNALLKQFFSNEKYPYQQTKKLIDLLEKAGVVEFVPVD
jgi:hypothetical protein